MTIPFKIYNIETGVNDDWSVVFFQGSAPPSPATYNCKAQLIDWYPIVYEFDHNSTTFTLPTTSMKFKDVHRDSANSLYLLIEFLTGLQVFTQGVPIKAWIYSGATLKYKFVVDFPNIKYNLEQGDITVPLILDLYFNLKDLVLTEQTHRDYIESILGTSSGNPNTDTPIITAADYLNAIFNYTIKGEYYNASLIQGLASIDYEFYTDYDTFAFDELVLNREMRNCVYGYTTVDDGISDTIKSHYDVVHEICVCLCLKYGIDETCTPFVVQKYKRYMDDLTIIPDSKIIYEASEIKFTDMRKGYYAPQFNEESTARGYSAKATDGLVSLDSNGNALNSDNVVTIAAKLGWGLHNTAGSAEGDLCAFNVTPYNDYRQVWLRFLNYNGIDYITFDPTEYSEASMNAFISFCGFSKHWDSIGKVKHKFVGTSYNMYTNYRTRLKFPNADTKEIMIQPDRIEKDIWRSTTVIEGIARAYDPAYGY